MLKEAEIHDPTAVGMPRFSPEEGEEGPSCPPRHSLQIRGRAFKKETFPLARQL